MLKLKKKHAVLLKLILGISVCLFLLLSGCSLESNHLTGDEDLALDSSPDTRSVSCNLPSGTIEVHSDEMYYSSHYLSGFATAMYYFSVSTSGNLPLYNLTLKAYPGFTTSSGVEGFIGPSTRVYFSFIVGHVFPEKSKDITITIYNVAGQTVCRKKVSVILVC
jgi:hypothetical protein